MTDTVHDDEAGDRDDEAGDRDDEASGGGDEAGGDDEAGDRDDEAGDDDTVVIHIRDGDLRFDGSWVYVWTDAGDGRVVYVGATGLPPVLRTWLHLHGDDPAVGRVAHRYAVAGRSLPAAVDVTAFRVPDGVPRADVRSELVRLLGRHGRLSPGYVGDPPAAGDADARAAAFAGEVLARLA